MSTKKLNPFNPKKYAKPGLREEEVIEIKEAFDLFDMDGGGTIDPKEMLAAIKAMGLAGNIQTITSMIHDMDADGSGSVDFQEFIDMMTASMDEKTSRDDTYRVFQYMDLERTNQLTFANVKRVAAELGETMTDEELREMMAVCDIDKDGAITPDDFYQCLTKKCLEGQLAAEAPGPIASM
eukprot:GILK01000582.1.p1 GENE.GILK01000582.1~~GILK01000582.1.p1  ORF type:complete len:198 (+),score=52.14 GILK01000582.1:54-596(+)